MRLDRSDYQDRSISRQDHCKFQAGNVLASGLLHVRDGQYIARVADSAVVSENHGGYKISTGETSSALNN